METITQVCKKCGIEKPISEYYAHRSNLTGYDHRCKKCVQEYSKIISKTYRAKNKERIMIKKREYRKTHPEKARYRPYVSSERVKKLALDRYHAKKPHQVAALLVRNKIKTGQIIKPIECEKCGAVSILHGHHEDYSKPLHVIWLCEVCHLIAHGKKSRKTFYPCNPPRHGV